MPDEHRKLASVSHHGKPSGDPHAGRGQTEELLLVAERIDRAVKLLAEIGENLAKVAPKHKRIFDDATMAIGEVGVLLGQATGAAAAGTRSVLSPMPGIIVQCDKKVGDEVKKGDLILTLDAMKMENLITAPAAGKVVSLPFGEGKKVAKGAVLAVIS